MLISRDDSDASDMFSMYARTAPIQIHASSDIARKIQTQTEIYSAQIRNLLVLENSGSFMMKGGGGVNRYS